MLEVAEVAGVEFVAAAVAAGLEAEADAVEEHCEALVEQQLPAPRGGDDLAQRDGAARYTFVHALYQQVVYERLGRAARAAAPAPGGCLEDSQVQAGEIAAELAEHLRAARISSAPCTIYTRRRRMPYTAVPMWKPSGT